MSGSLPAASSWTTTRRGSTWPPSTASCPSDSYWAPDGITRQKVRRQIATGRTASSAFTRATARSGSPAPPAPSVTPVAYLMDVYVLRASEGAASAWASSWCGECVDRRARARRTPRSGCSRRCDDATTVHLTARRFRLRPAAASAHASGPGASLGSRRGAAELPGDDRRARALLGRLRLRGHAAVPHRGRRGHVQPGHLPALPRARSPGGRPTSSRRSARPTAATARTRTASSTTSSTRSSSSRRPTTSSTSTSARSRRSGSTSAAHDVRLVEDDWEAPTLGAWGLGWEVWVDGMEVTQFTYFQQLGGLDLDLVPAEITYGARAARDVPPGQDERVRRSSGRRACTWGDVYRENERQWSVYNFEEAPVDMLVAPLRASTRRECERAARAAARRCPPTTRC